MNQTIPGGWGQPARNPLATNWQGDLANQPTNDTAPNPIRPTNFTDGPTPFDTTVAPPEIADSLPALKGPGTTTGPQLPQGKPLPEKPSGTGKNNLTPNANNQLQFYSDRLSVIEKEMQQIENKLNKSGQIIIRNNTARYFRNLSDEERRLTRRYKQLWDERNAIINAFNGGTGKGSIVEWLSDIMPWNWGADNKTEEVIKLINSEMLIVAGFNDLLGTSHRSIADFTAEERKLIEQYLKTPIDWESFPSVQFKNAMGDEWMLDVGEIAVNIAITADVVISVAEGGILLKQGGKWLLKRAGRNATEITPAQAKKILEEATENTTGTASKGLDDAVESANGVVAPSGNVQANRAAGQVGEDFLTRTYGGQNQVTRNTSLGQRVIDNLANGISRESKVGRTSLTQRVRLQIAKDVELLNNARSGITSVEWHFFPSSTGVGPTAPLRRALEQANIRIVIH
ncbi:MAG: hypothetical protein KDA76_08900 [Planctomycetaceae bacterium]|nr:hypothetical protein [Planctomycetaceae bacterium]